MPEIPISVVISAPPTGADLLRCLKALWPQAEREGAEVIVEHSGDEAANAIHERFPQVRYHHHKEALTIHEMRGLGIAASKGQVIALLDAYSIVDSNWLSQVLKAHRENLDPVIGGIVEPYDSASQTLGHWAMYINEYARFMAPREAGRTDILAASNISYKRSALFTEVAPKFPVFWKEFVNRALVSAGHGLRMEPSIVVHSRKLIPIAAFLRSRYDNGRCFAGMRAADYRRGRRILYALATPLLPPLFLWRCASHYWVKRRFRAQFLLTIPLQVLLFVSWSAGELAGYLRGPGNSCRVLYY
jgi:hypothetical protein